MSRRAARRFRERVIVLAVRRYREVSELTSRHARNAQDSLDICPLGRLDQSAHIHLVQRKKLGHDNGPRRLCHRRIGLTEDEGVSVGQQEEGARRRTQV